VLQSLSGLAIGALLASALVFTMGFGVMKTMPRMSRQLPAPPLLLSQRSRRWRRRPPLETLTFTASDAGQPRIPMTTQRRTRRKPPDLAIESSWTRMCSCSA
jgi:hypothetical protein